MWGCRRAPAYTAPPHATAPQRPCRAASPLLLSPSTLQPLQGWTGCQPTGLAKATAPHPPHSTPSGFLSGLSTHTPCFKSLHPVHVIQSPSTQVGRFSYMQLYSKLQQGTISLHVTKGFFPVPFGSTLFWLSRKRHVSRELPTVGLTPSP